MNAKGRLGIIGCGNMARGIVAGVLERRLHGPRDILAYDILPVARHAFRRRFRVPVARNAQAVFERSEIVLLAVKPQQMSAALAGVKIARIKTQLLITILAGMPRRRVAALLPRRVSVVRAMPNLGATVGASFTAISGTGKRNLGRAKKLFSGCGSVVTLPERHLDLVTALSGSGPAYFFFLMEILAREGRRHGLSRTVSERLAVETAWGAARLARRAAESPEHLRKKVTSKGGTTEAAMTSLASSKVSAAFTKAIRCALGRAHQLGGG